MFMPTDTDFAITRNAKGEWSATPISEKAKTVLPSKRVISDRDINATIAGLKVSGFKVYDPEEFYRTARPLTGVVITDNFSKD